MTPTITNMILIVGGAMSFGFCLGFLTNSAFSLTRLNDLYIEIDKLQKDNFYLKMLRAPPIPRRNVAEPTHSDRH